jgi:hypothetical protein
MQNNIEEIMTAYSSTTITFAVYSNGYPFMICDTDTLLKYLPFGASEIMRLKVDQYLKRSGYCIMRIN